jgi:3-oxoacyl-[acyl-carrier protein] reductase
MMEPLALFNLEGKTALITGASGGIGRAAALLLAQAGASLIVSGTRREALEETVKALPAGCAASIITSDLSQPGAGAALLEKAEAAGGHVDILVNNAGLTRDGLALRMKEEDWQTVLHVNLTACFQLSQACLKGMMKARWGRIINISSIVGLTGNPGQANYAAAKAGLAGFSKSLALEVASRGITVNCVAPGFITTPMTDKLNEQQKAAMLPRIPLGRFGAPENVAAAVLYLAAESGRYVTGQTIHVNGGMAMP